MPPSVTMYTIEQLQTKGSLPGRRSGGSHRDKRRGDDCNGGSMYDTYAADIMDETDAIIEGLGRPFERVHIAVGLPSMTDMTTEKKPLRLGAGGRQDIILRYVEQYGPSTCVEIATTLGMNESNVFGGMRLLRDRGAIAPAGKVRRGRTMARLWALA